MLLAITGASAAGKSTLAAGICRARTDACLLGSITTRRPRDNDMPGEYAYAAHAEFDALVASQAFIWHVGVHGNRYGTLRARVDEALDSPDISIAIITIDALRILRAYALDAQQLICLRAIHLCAASEPEMRRRLHKRYGADDDEAARRFRDCVRWDAEARTSGIPILFLDSSQPKEHVLDTALGYLSAATGRCSIPPTGA